MAIVQDICALALRPLIGESADKAVQLICTHLIDQSQRLPLALRIANDRAWTALELALVGETWWEKLWNARKSAEERALATQIQEFLARQALTELQGHPAGHRQECRRELRLARQQHLISGASLEPTALAGSMLGFKRFVQPEQLIREDLEVIGRMASRFNVAGFPHLSWLLNLQVTRGASLLVVAVRYFFRRQVEEDRQLFQGLAFAQLEALGKAQETGLDALQAVMTRHANWMQDTLGSIDEKIDDLHEKVDRLQEQIAELLRLARLREEMGAAKQEAPQPEPASPVPPAQEPPPRSAVSETWISCGGVELSLQVHFDHTAYPADDDPNVRFLFEMAMRRGRAEPRSVMTADIVLLLDVSGSMNRPDRYPLLCKAVEAFLRRLKPTDQVGIVLFSTTADLVIKLHLGQKATPAAGRILQRMDSSAVRFGKHTCLAPGLQRAVDLFGAARSQSVRRLYILTDGELHDGPFCGDLLNATRERRIEVHVYGFGDAFDGLALKQLVQGQLGGSVKPICTEEDIVGTFAHVAEVNSRLIARDARLIMEFNPQVVCGDAWTFRPLSRPLGRVRNRKLEHDLGGIEEGRTTSLLLEVQLPPDRSVVTPVAYARLAWQDEQGEAQHWQVISTARLLVGDPGIGEPVARVVQAFAVLDALRRPQDQQAELAAAEARLELALVEKRQDPKLLAALTGHLAMLQGRSDSAQLQQNALAYLQADRASVDPREMAQYLVADRRTVQPGDARNDPVGRLQQLQTQLMLVREEVLQLPELSLVQDQVNDLRVQLTQQSQP